MELGRLRVAVYWIEFCPCEMIDLLALMKAVSLLLKRWLFLSFLCLKLALTPAEQ